MILGNRKNHSSPDSRSNSSERPASDDHARGLVGILFQTAVGSVREIANQGATPRAWLLAGGHAAVFAAAYWFAYLLRFGYNVSDPDFGIFRASLWWVLGAQLVVFGLLGQFHGWWRYVTFADLTALLRASAVSLVILASVDYFLRLSIPRGIILLDGILIIAMFSAVRASWRMFREVFHPMLNGKDSRWALLVGTDLSNGILAHQIQSHFRLPYRVRGFLSTDPSVGNAYVGQIPVLGILENVREIAEAYRATDVLVVAGTLSGPRLRTLMEACEKGGLSLKIIRPLEDRLGGDEHVPIRDIEINDLLGRDPISLDTDNIDKLLEGRRVMVTGAGGSIGSEICRQIIGFRPESLILVGRGENRIFAIERELRALKTSTSIEACIADVTNRDRMEQVFRAHRPEVVFTPRPTSMCL
jgi:FlaA1/EpsC-like NDP-sugar epimerase